jgi:hypothetical protein
MPKRDKRRSFGLHFHSDDPAAGVLCRSLVLGDFTMTQCYTRSPKSAVVHNRVGGVTVENGKDEEEATPHDAAPFSSTSSRRARSGLITISSAPTLPHNDRISRM